MLSLLSVLMPVTLSPFQKGLLEDAKVLRSAYVSMHPGLYRYNSPAQIEAALSSLESRWSKAKDLREAYLDLSLFTASIRCGHTYPNFFNQKKEVVREVFSGRNRVPFHFRWLGGQMVVIADRTAKHTMPPGTVVEAIDGISTAKILDRMMKIARADGGNDAKRLSILSPIGRSKFEEFDIYFPLMFPIPDGRFAFDIRTIEGTRKQIQTEALSMEDRIRDSQEQGAKDGDRWAYKDVNPQIGLLTMPTFVMYDNKWNWKEFLSKTFDHLGDKRMKSLVIDLRGNEGGSDIGSELLAYMVDKPTEFGQYRLYTRYKTVSPKLKPFLDTWDRTFDDWTKWCGPSERIEAGRNDFFHMTLWDNQTNNSVLPKPNRFKGKVFVLVDNSNSSATFEFELRAQSHRLATLVGEPTGGNLRGINGSAFYFLYLPNSQLEVDLPLVGQFPKTAQPDRGLTPDVMAIPSVQNIAAGKDAAMEKALRLAEAAPDIR